jgi:hypothetical protein
MSVFQNQAVQGLAAVQINEAVDFRIPPTYAPSLKGTAQRKIAFNHAANAIPPLKPIRTQPTVAQARPLGPDTVKPQGI